MANDNSLYGSLLKKGWMKDFFPNVNNTDIKRNKN